MFTVNAVHLNASSRPARRFLFLILALVAILLAACGDRSTTESAAPAVHMILIPDPAGDALTVQLSDADGQPLSGGQVSITGNMTHPGMAPVIGEAVADDADGVADGSYRIPFQFSMLGDWILTVAATLPDGSTVSQDIPVAVTEGGVTVPDTGSAASVSTGASASTGLQITNAHARPAPTTPGNSALFLTIVNAGAEADRLLSVTTPVAAAELHETVDDNGVMRMVARPEGFAIPANGTLELAPGGKHIMLLNLTQPLQPGQSLAVTLTFEHASPLTLNAPVLEMDATMPEHNGP